MKQSTKLHPDFIVVMVSGTFKTRNFSIPKHQTWLPGINHKKGKLIKAETIV